MYFGIYLVYIIANIMEVFLYKSIYYDNKTIEDINVFKNIYLFFAEGVPMIISNIYIALCVIW